MRKQLLAVAAVLVMSSSASAQSIPLDLSSGMPVVEAKIGDNGPYRFAIDTSVKSSLILDKSIATGQRVNVTLGRVNFGWRNAAIADVRSQYGVDGIVGFGLFRNVLASFDLANRELRISEGSLMTKNAPVLKMKLFDGVPGVLADVDGRYFFAAINTGLAASSSVKGSELHVGPATVANTSLAMSKTSLPNLGNDFLKAAVVTFDTKNALIAIEQ